MVENNKHDIKFEAGKNTHENVIFSCFGGMSNTGIVAALSSMDAVKHLGLKKACIGCMGGLPTDLKPVHAKANAAKKIVTVDGCPMECAKKIVEKSGLNISKSIVLVHDINMKKKPLHEDIISDSIKSFDEYIDENDVKRATEIIVKSITE